MGQFASAQYFKSKRPKFAIDMALKPYLYQMCELFLPITGDDVNLGYIFLANLIAGSIAAMTSSIICYPRPVVYRGLKYCLYYFIQVIINLHHYNS